METLPASLSFRLDGRRALVTGAGRGIGVAIAAALGQAGAHLVLAARTFSEVEAVAEAIRQGGGDAEPVELDVRDLAQVDALVSDGPPFDVVVSNAGTNRPKRLIDVTEEDYEAVLGLNLKASYFLARASAKRMIETNTHGSIIFMSSQMGHVGAPNRTLYCASKHAVEGLTKAMAVELAPYRIRVNAIAPTFVKTPMTEPFFQDRTFAEQVLARIPLGRLSLPEEIAAAAVYLASEASRTVTGTSLKVDGGWTAQ